MQDAMRNGGDLESPDMERLQRQAIWACDRIAVEEILQEGDTKRELLRLMKKGWMLKEADAVMSLVEESDMSESDAEHAVRAYFRDRGLRQTWLEP